MNRNKIIISIVALTFLIFSLIVGKWTESNIEFWAAHFGNNVDMPYWLSVFATLVLGPLALVANIVSEIVELFV